MALTMAQLIGTPALADEFTLDGAIEIGKKASGGGSAIAVGRIAMLSGANWAIGASGSTGRGGVIPKLHPANVDADTELQVATRVGAEYYVEMNGTINPGSQVLPDTGGKIKATSGAGIGIYKGHYGEGFGLGNAPTPGAAGEAGRIELTGTLI